MPFPHHLAGHCGSGALCDLLEFHHLDFGAGVLSEGMAFGLGAGLGFLYMEIPGFTPPVYVVGRTADMERDFAEHLGIALEVRSTADPVEGWGWVREEIDAGRPTMVLADIAELEYLRVRMTNTRHVIVIVDYDDADQVAWVADNDRDELQRCSLASLAAARNSQGFPGPNAHTTFIYDWPDALDDPRVAASAAVRRAVSNMLGGGAALAGTSGATGLVGIERFAAAYRDWPVMFGEALPQALMGLGVFIVKAGTGGAMFRSLHARFLNDMADLLETRQLRRAAAIYDELSATWVALADAAASLDHAAGLDAAAALAGLERSGVAAMQQWLAEGAGSATMARG
ncbi:BtrH N-terminal domain-containing protein [Conexibacter sp. DBS9H8]|uniref:BtrH N-terminal domain-containing protein n=1 Tax=Conexibacter sp. DBS9H8 TaxID=2937801 RepID=UPI00200D537F|nr:BtrH N-terminal domain-containing protein [Conexibacter sp. DBS9H8]